MTEIVLNRPASPRNTWNCLGPKTGDKSPANYRVVPSRRKAEGLILTPMGVRPHWLEAHQWPEPSREIAARQPRDTGSHWVSLIAEIAESALDSLFCISAG